MFKNLFKHKQVSELNCFEQSSINLFSIDVLMSVVSVFIGMMLMFSINYEINEYTIFTLFFVILYIISFLFIIRHELEISYLLYHFSSYTLVLYLVFLFGQEANFQLYFFCICFSIYLYSIEKKNYQKYLLFLYVLTFIVTNLISHTPIFSNDATQIHFLEMINLIIASGVISLKYIKYVDLKEKAVQKYKSSHLKSVETKRALKDKETMFNFMFNSSIDGAELSIYSAISQEEIAYDANKALIKLLKMDKESIKNISRLSFSPEIQSNGKKSYEYDKEIKELVQKNNQYRYEWDYINGDGEIVNTEVTQVRLKEKDKIINLGFIKDITTKKNTEKELLESELMYRTLFENVYDGIKIDIYDKQSGKTLNQFVNRKMLSLFKINEYDFGEDNYMQFIPEHQLNNKSSVQLISELREEFEKNALVNFRMNLIDINKEPFTADFTAIQIETSKTRKIVLIAKDVTEIVKNENIIKKQISSLKKKKNELVKYIESNKQLELFAFRASHDLKGPISTATKFVDIFKKRNEHQLDEESLRYLHCIESSISHLNSFIDDCLNHSRITSNKINIQNINPTQLIQIVLNNLKSTIEETNARIYVGKMPNWINADEIKLITVFQNLVSNALRYRKKDVVPYIKIEGIEQESCYQFSIADNGIGIKNEHQIKIFDLYESFCDSSFQQQGSGIGLSTCLKLIELHKGKIWVESVYGKSSTFYFQITKNLNQILNN